MSISQGVIALLEGYIISGSFNNALLYGGSTYLSSAFTNWVNPSGFNELETKQAIEPLRAALLAMAGKYVFSSKLVKEEGKYKYLKTAGKAFIITGSSAGLDQVVNNRSMGGSSYAQAAQVLEVQRQNNLVGNNVRSSDLVVPKDNTYKIASILLGVVGGTAAAATKIQLDRINNQLDTFEI